jgi:hypothetical protein
MSCGKYEIELSEYVDGTLDQRTRAELDAHLAECEPCRAVILDLNAIRHAVRSLEPELPSPRVWAQLSAAIEAENRSPFHRWGFTWQSLAGTLVPLVVVASLTWMGSRLASTTASTGQLASATEQTSVPSVEAQFDFAEAQYTTAIAGLESIARSEQALLDMETADVFQVNLSVIDGAITESRAALLTEPDSAVAQESLFDALRSKLELLQDVVALINEMRKGNPEGAARIVSGINQ